MVLSKTELSEVVAERLAGKQWRELSEKTGIPLSSLQKLVKSHPDYSEKSAGSSMRSYVSTADLPNLPEIKAVLEGRMKPHEAAQHFGVNLGTLENRLRKVRAASAEQVRASVPPAPAPGPQDNVEVPARFARPLLPLISWVAAGAWGEANDPFLPGDAEDWLPCPKACSPSSYVLRVRGTSMTAPAGARRSYPEDSLIFVDPERRSPVNGDRVIARLVKTNEVTFKVYRADGEKQWLMPLNPQEEAPVGEFHVIGTVIGGWVD